MTQCECLPALNEECAKHAQRAFGHANRQKQVQHLVPGYKAEKLTEYDDTIPLHVQIAGSGDVPVKAQATALGGDAAMCVNTTKSCCSRF